ncbi:hypothetical protein NUW54_g12231 [Trametes sanguinea]|uniref:Uncharacterized protein n=1 Tax=Trametes sanguinea TaxID=158606 RepID=A0ACC1N020_9APHY|nr:hypothetical protein NUW54_g12231 [Trametes sanguinea]
MNTPGEVVIDGLPTGSLFSFLWNLLVSISFQFVGFLLTYLLHTTHAAKLGSRAGLGITLIQYGFALRGKDVTYGASEQDVWGGWKPEEPRPTFGTAAEAEAYYNNLNLTATSPSPTIDTPPEAFASSDATTEWLSFLLMTIGWFILLTSVLGSWRVRRIALSFRRLSALTSRLNVHLSSSVPLTIVCYPEAKHLFLERGSSPMRASTAQKKAGHIVLLANAP